VGDHGLEMGIQEAGCKDPLESPVTCIKTQGGSGAIGCTVYVDTGDVYETYIGVPIWEPDYHGWAACTAEQYNAMIQMPACE
jgi:hypothetical protein